VQLDGILVDFARDGNAFFVVSLCSGQVTMLGCLF